MCICGHFTELKLYFSVFSQTAGQRVADKNLLCLEISLFRRIVIIGFLSFDTVLGKVTVQNTPEELRVSLTRALPGVKAAYFKVFVSPSTPFNNVYRMLLVVIKY